MAENLVEIGSKLQNILQILYGRGGAALERGNIFLHFFGLR